MVVLQLASQSCSGDERGRCSAAMFPFDDGVVAKDEGHDGGSTGSSEECDDVLAAEDSVVLLGSQQQDAGKPTLATRARRATPYAALLLGTIMFSFMAVILKSLSDLTPIVRAGWRLQIALIGNSVVVGLLWVLRWSPVVRSAIVRQWRSLAKCGVLFCLHFISFNYSLSMTSYVHAVLIAGMVPVCVVVLRVWKGAILRPLRILVRCSPERPFCDWTALPRGSELLGVSLCTIGVAFAAIASAGSASKGSVTRAGISDRSTLAGDAVGIAAVMLFAMYVVAQKDIAEPVPAPALQWFVSVVGSIVTLVAAVLTQSPLHNAASNTGLYDWPFSSDLSLALVGGLVGGCVAHVLLSYAVTHCGVLLVSLSSTTLPVITSALAYMFGVALPPGPQTLVGAMLILAGIVSTVLGPRIVLLLRHGPRWRATFVARKIPPRVQINQGFELSGSTTLPMKAEDFTHRTV